MLLNIVRMQSAEEDRHNAWINSLNADNLDEMFSQLYKPGNPADTHFLYLNIARIAYRKRDDAKMMELFKKIAVEHISIFNTFIPALLCKTSEGLILPHVPTFQWLVTIYSDEGEYEKAIEVCEKAIRLGLHDGTKGDYQGRINKIINKAAKKGIKLSYPG